jgi:uncharacterized protein YbjT (DUF2867 family)
VTGLRVVVFGATGTAGSESVRQALADPRVVQVRAITRRALDLTHDKLREVRCADFAFLSDIGESLTDVDACFFCLGTSSRQVAGESEYRRITVDYALAAARILRQHSPGHTFHYLSGAGTDPGGRSRMMWARVKGEAENALRAAVPRLFCLRPGHIHTDDASPLNRMLYPLARRILPGHVIHAAELARAMIEATVSAGPGAVLDNHELRALARGEGPPSTCHRTASDSSLRLLE